VLGTEVVVPARAGKNPLTMRRLQRPTDKTLDYADRLHSFGDYAKGLRVFVLR
jgi:hypothetical protein